MPGAGRRPPTAVNMVDVAEHAGVSTATVSRALRDVPGVSQKTRTRIRRIASELSYVVSPEASRLSGQRTGRVGVVVPRLDVWFYAAMLAGLERVLRRSGLDVLVYQVDGLEQRRRFFTELPARRKVDALILVALPLLEEEADRLDLLGVHVVVAGGQIGAHPHVRVDDHALAVAAVGQLVSDGHQRIAMVRTDDTTGAQWSSDIERVRGYQQAMARAGLRPVSQVVTVSYSAGAGVRSVPLLLALDPRPTAIFAYSDEVALALVHELRRLGWRVPGDFSVIGVDDHPLAAVLGLSTVAQHVPEQARLSGEIALGLLERGADAGRALLLEPDLVLRDTTGPPSR